VPPPGRIRGERGVCYAPHLMSARFAIGVDFGGTHLRAALVHESGREEHFLQRGSGAGESAAAPIDAIAEAVAGIRSLAGGSVIGVGVGSPGVIDPETGVQVGRTPHQPHWTDYPLRDRLRASLALPVWLDNDANLAALAEHRLGAARGARVSMMVTVGTGVGCGIVVGDEILRGAFGGAGEIGHLPLGDGRLACRCGVERCVEPEMSGNGLARQAEALGISARDAAALFEAAGRGDHDALLLVERLGDRLGAAIATAVNLINPDVVVIGGGVAQAGEALLDRIRRGVNRYALESHRRTLRIVPAALGIRAGVVGAGLMAWKAFGSGKAG